MRQHLMRLDRIAGQMNGWLLLIAIGLGMLDLSVLIVKSLPPAPMPPAASSAGARDHAGLFSPLSMGVESRS